MTTAEQIADRLRTEVNIVTGMLDDLPPDSPDRAELRSLLAGLRRDLDVAEAGIAAESPPPPRAFKNGN